MFWFFWLWFCHVYGFAYDSDLWFSLGRNPFTTQLTTLTATPLLVKTSVYYHIHCMCLNLNPFVWHSILHVNRFAPILHVECWMARNCQVNLKFINKEILANKLLCRLIDLYTQQTTHDVSNALLSNFLLILLPATCFSRNVRLYINEKTLRLAQRHVSQTKSSFEYFLVGSISVDSGK